MVRRIYVEKKDGFDVEAQGMFADIRENLHVDGLTGIRVLNRYDIDGIDDATYERAKYTVFAEPAIDTAYDEEMPDNLGSATFLRWNICRDSTTRERIRRLSASN